MDWMGRLLLSLDGDDGDEAVPSTTTTSLGGGGGAAVLPVDCRSAQDYAAGHIKGALNLALPALIQRRLVKGNLPMASVFSYCVAGGGREAAGQSRGPPVDSEADLWKLKRIVLYDESTSLSSLHNDSPDGQKVIGVLLKRLKESGYDAHLLDGGLNKFRSKYPDLCVSSRNDKANNNDKEEEEEEKTNKTGLASMRNLRITTTTADGTTTDRGGGEVEDQPLARDHFRPPEAVTRFPVEVLPHLFLGDANNAADLDVLEGKGIKYILNVTPNVPNNFETNGGFKYLQIPIKDHWSQNLTNYFPQAITFIDEGRNHNYGVLVHCLAGISRSVTVTVAYLMYSMSLSLDDAYEYVKRRKPNVSPNLTFMGQLLDFENTLKVQRQGSACSCACHLDPGGCITSSAVSSSSSTAASAAASVPSLSSSSSSTTEPGICRPGACVQCSELNSSACL